MVPLDAGGEVGVAVAATGLRSNCYIVTISGGLSPKFGRNDLDKVRGNLESAKGLGEPMITAFLDGVPGCDKGTVAQQLASLKASGDYARIVGEVPRWRAVA